ncbi:MAG TPA: hypothetical protein PLK80_01620 [bacterium]|nr:MAG: hypothetical protein BWY28_02754 [bacterium ADurb.Bin236]HOY63999.1 hypothetical protein [bacterium]HPI75405.1 hypothetical protein [bacterium]HPN94927.1 hypothetical protein [bacterium]
MSRKRKWMKAVGAAAMALTVLAMSAGAARAEADVSGSVAWVSKYIWRGQDLLADNESAIQPSLDFSWSSGWAFNMWMSYGLDGDSELDELDYTLSYSASSKLMPGAEWTVGHIYYTFPSIADESQESFVTLEWPDAFLSPSMTVYSDWDAGDGVYAYAGISRDIPIGGEAGIPALSLSSGLGYSDGQWGLEPGVSNIDIGASMSFQAGDFEIVPSLNYVITPGDRANTENEFWAGVGIGFSF